MSLRRISSLPHFRTLCAWWKPLFQADLPFFFKQYFLSVVPTTYIDRSGRTLYTNQYSVTDMSRETEHGRGVPGIFFKYGSLFTYALSFRCLMLLFLDRHRTNVPNGSRAYHESDTISRSVSRNYRRGGSLLRMGVQGGIMGSRWGEGCRVQRRRISCGSAQP